MRVGVVKKIVVGILGTAAMALTYNNCSNGGGGGGGSSPASAPTSVNSAGPTQTAAVVTSSLGLSVLDSSGTEVFNDATSGSTLSVNSGSSYTFVVNCSSNLTSASLTLTLTNLSLPGQAPVAIPVNCGSNTISSSYFTGASGSSVSYSAVLAATSGGQVVVNNSYSAVGNCNSADKFDASYLKASGVKLTQQAGKQNVYDIDASGIIANPQNYTCALDFTGTNIIDTQVQPCNKPFKGIVTNFVDVAGVDQRNVHVRVQNLCSSPQLTVPLTFNYTLPAQGAGNVYIFAQTKDATGDASSDPRDENVNYLATNQDPLHVDASFEGADQSSGTANTFTINSRIKYSQANSQEFGVYISISGFKQDVNSSNSNLTLSSSNSGASMSISFSTDKDVSNHSKSLATYTTSNCSFQTQGKYITVTGTPCSGTQNKGANIQRNAEVWGTYTCTAATDAGGGSIKISGSFDGTWNWSSSCYGGGGGGGGIVPVSL